MKKLGKLLFFAAITALLTCLLCVALSATQYSGNCGKDGNNVTWSLDTETGVLKIEGKGAMAKYTWNVNAPWYDYRDSIKTVSISNGVSSIGDHAFRYCGKIESITMPESIGSIGANAFRQCTSLTSLVIPSSVESIGANAIRGCTNLANITLPSGLTSVGDYALEENPKLNYNEYDNAYYLGNSQNPYVVLVKAKDSSVESCEVNSNTNIIYFSAFQNCTKLTGIRIHGNITWIGAYAFDGCTKLANVTFDGGAKTLQTMEYIFRNCTSLTAVTIPQNASYLYGGTFAGCTSLEKVVLLSYATRLVDMENTISNTATIWGYSGSYAEAYATKYNRKFVAIIANGKCGENLTWMLDETGLLTIEGTGAMEDYSSAGATPWAEYRTMITSAEISEGITSLGKYSLWNFSNLTNLVIPSTITTIKTYTIRVPLTSLVIPEGIKSIEQNAICWCPNLTEVVIPESMEKMAGLSFRSCGNLKKIFILSKNVEISGLLNWSSYTVYGYVGSTAEEHATKQNRKFVPFNGYCGAEGDGSNIAWYFDFKTGELSLNGTGEMKDYYSTIDVPWYMLAKRVNSVDISDGITKISSEAFSNCRSLKAIHIPKDVKSFGGWSVFAWCDALETMTVAEENTVYHSEGNCIIETASKTLKFGCKTSIIPDDGSVTSIGNLAFDRCNIENITIPECIVSIGTSAFIGCDNLTNITIPKNVTSIGGGVFGGCRNLENIYVDAENTSYYVKNNCLIEKESKTLIAGCNDSIIPDDGSVTVIGSNALSGRKMIRVTIPNGITTIGFAAFSVCPNLESVSIPNSVTTIELSAFGSNLKLTHITIPASVTAIEMKAFGYCNNLASITILSKDVEISDTADTIPENTIIYGYSGSTAEAYATKYDRKFAVFSGTCGAEGDGSNLVWFFDAETGLLKIDGTGKMQTPILTDAWKNKYIVPNIKTIEISEGVTSIGRGAFMGCYNLVNVSMPDSLVTIEMYAFNGCTSLEKIYIPAGVACIEYDILGACDNLESITVAKENITYHSKRNCIIETASGTLVSGCKSSVIPTDGSVKAIAPSAFSSCKYLLNITIPSSVVSIGFNAFNGCVGLTEIIIPDSVIEIGYSAFGNCSGLTEITIPASVTKIDGAIIWGKDVKLTGIYVDKASNSFKSVDGILFTKDGKRLVNYLPGKEDKSYTVPRGVETIGMLAFSDSNIESIDMPDSVTSIEGWAFSVCSSLTNINIPDKVTNIKEWAFYYCTALTSIVIPSSVTNISENAFHSCTSLTAVTILSKDVEIHDDSYAIPDTATIYGYSGSTAEAYATKYNRKFVVLRNIIASGYCGAEGDGSNLTWALDDKGLLTIDGTGAMAGYSSGYTPWNNYNSSINSVEISDGVTTIGKNSVKYTNAVSISMPESITRIESAGFEGNEKLLSIVIPANVEYIGDYAFNNCTSLENITFEKNSKLTEISSAAFGYCIKLCSLEIPASVTSIATSSSGFVYGNYSMTSLTVANGNTVYHSNNNCIIETATKSLIAGCKTSTIPTDGSVVVIESGAFDRSNISSIVIPESVTDIKMWTFGSCNSLQKITILNKNANIANDVYAIYAGATIVGYSGSTAEAYAAKYNRTFVALKNIVASGTCGENLTWMLDETGLLTIEGTGTMDDYPSRNIPWYEYRSSIKSVEIRDGVTSIGSHAFSVCNSLMSITIPDSVTRIGNGAFAGCDDLTSITFGENSQLTSIGDNAFDLCCIITGISIPNNVISIGSRAFQSCRSLTDITIPNSVISIGDNAFYDCSSLTSINVDESNKNYKSINGVLFTKDEEILIAYPAAKSETTYIIPSGVTSIRSSAFFGCSSLTSVEIPSSVTSIGSSAFYNCSSLTSIEIPSGVTSIKANTFSGCNSLTSVKIPTSVTSIEDYAFRGCDFTSIEIPNSVTNIGLGAFYACGNLTSIEIPSGVTSIRRDTFTGCGLTSVTISNCVTSIEDYAFSGCTSLTSIEIPSSVISIGMYTFEGCSSLVSITMHSGVTYIGCGAFYGCSSLTSITIPDSILSIEWRTFSVCDSLVSITILSKDTVIYDSADAIPEAATIYGYSGSTAEAYATKYNRKFVAIDKYNSMNAGATLNENITMNFIGTALTKEDVDGNDFKMTFVMNGSKTSVSPVEKNGKYTFPFAGIAPQCMNDEISYEMTMNGAVVKQGSISVSGYLKKLIETKPENMTDAKFKAMSTLVSDMLNYGSAAQAYTGHGTDSLLNENYYDDIVNKYTELESTDKALSGAAPAGAKFTNVGVRFDNVNKVFFRFTADDVSNVIITINGVVYEQDKFVKTGDKYTVYSEDVLASKFDTVYTAILTYRGLDEQQMMTYSVKSFAYSFQNKRGEDGKLTAEAVLARATYTYGVSARAYENAE